ncbi:MAG: dihydroorotase [Candidatus Omnitrophota bacterium]
MGLLIKNGHLLDPENNLDTIADLLIIDRKIVEIKKNISASRHGIINAEGRFVLPALFDMHTHLRQPGREDEETILSGSLAAAKGGFAAVCCMPNTTPPLDDRGIIEYIIAENKKNDLINIYPVGAMTKGLKGEQISEIADLKRAGVLAISDDGCTVQNSMVMRRALEYAKMYDLLVISHCEDISLSGGGVINEGYISTLLGLKGIPAEAETIIVARDIQLAAFTGARVHIAHVSCKGSVELLRQAKRAGIKITAETCPHYFTLTEKALISYNPDLKMNPPLRTEEDKKAVIDGLKDATIDCIASDHAPHTEAEKDLEFDLAPFGIIGLETAFSLGIKELVNNNVLSLSELILKMSANPGKILGIRYAGLNKDAIANLIVVDLQKTWVPDKNNIVSKSKNTPFIGWELPAVILATVVNGKIIYCLNH